MKEPWSQHLHHIFSDALSPQKFLEVEGVKPDFFLKSHRVRREIFIVDAKQ